MSDGVVGLLARDNIGFEMWVLAEDFVDAVVGSISEVKCPV